MEVVSFNNLHLIKEPLHSLAIGTFDALHPGHLKLLKKTLKLGGKNSGVLSFKNPPAEVFNAEKFLGRILTLDQKLESFSKLGFNKVILIDFSYEFSKLEGDVFLEQLLNIIDLRYVVIGADYRCGHLGMVTAKKIKEHLSAHKIKTITIRLKKNGRKKISSSEIRSLIFQGNLNHVCKLLGHEFELELPALPKSLAYPFKIPIDFFKQVIPEKGIFSFYSDNDVNGTVEFDEKFAHFYSKAKRVEKKIFLQNR